MSVITSCINSTLMNESISISLFKTKPKIELFVMPHLYYVLTINMQRDADIFDHARGRFFVSDVCFTHNDMGKQRLSERNQNPTVQLFWIIRLLLICYILC